MLDINIQILETMFSVGVVGWLVKLMLVGVLFVGCWSSGIVDCCSVVELSCGSQLN